MINIPCRLASGEGNVTASPEFASMTRSRLDERPIILCADDYAMTPGVSAGIQELAELGRLSAASALVTTPHWPAHARCLLPFRFRLAIGLHLNLTLGAPLGPMPNLAPAGELPRLKTLLGSALAGRVEHDEVEKEVCRQLERFESELGYAPDFIDGHQHVHALPGVRKAVVCALRQRYLGRRPLLRDPADSPVAIIARGGAAAKSLAVATLAAGFGKLVRRLGFRTNHGFSGISTFDERVPYSREFERFLARPGPRHLVMCHPGYPDAELARLDPVVARRRAELEALRETPDLPARLWRPFRTCGHSELDWPNGGARDA
jgi:chitin disaccharide deacetylase